MLLEKDFGFTRISYLMVYCVYTGACGLIQDVRAGDQAARAKMNTFIRALEGGRTTCPIVQRSLDIITNSLESEIPTTTENTIQAVDGTVGLPAFPREVFGDPGPSAGYSYGLDNDSHFWLDCFPENSVENWGDWYMPPA